MRLGIALRLIGILVLASLVVLEGSALRTRAFEGKTLHYTVVVHEGQDPAVVAAAHKGSGVHLEHTTITGNTRAYVASMPMGVAERVRQDPRVSYIEMDSQLTVRHNWWDTMMITLGVHTPHFN